MKRCSTCQELKNEKEFNKNKSKADGLQTICRACNKASSAAYYQNNKDEHKNVVYENKLANIKVLQEFVIEYLKEHVCVDCGESDYIVLEFDHVRGVKRKAISAMIQNSYSLDSLKEEIEKCDVRCANCHKRKSAKQLGYYKIKMGR
jgi:5-methylcytosine-specific restriction endonuclease McrA